MKNGRIKILQSSVDAVTQKEALENIRLFLSSSAGHQVVTLNSEMIVACEEDAQFRDIATAADLVVADGMGVLYAASFLQKRRHKISPDFANLFLTIFYAVFFPKKITDALPEKISGIDLMYAICGSDFAKGKKIYLLGAEEGIARGAGNALKNKYPHIEIAGAEAGVRKNFSIQDNAELIARINVKSPDIIFVALGAPRQEKWIAENLPELPSVRVAMGVGGSFDIIAGKIHRAPKIFQTHSLEWLWRLLREPKRIKRIYNATFKLSWLIFRDKKDSINE